MSDYSDASLVMYPSSRKTSELFSQKPKDDSGNFTVVRSTACDEIDINGDSTQVAIHKPRFDFKKKYVAPVDNSYYDFDGVNDIVDFGVRDPFGTNDFSIGSKININSLSSDKAVVSGGANSFELRVSTAGKIVIKKTDALTVGTGTTVLSLNTDYDIYYVRQSGVGTIYVDGVAEVTTLIDITDYTVGIKFLNSSLGLILFFNGRTYKASAWSLALTSQEVEDRFNGLPIPDKYKGANNSNVVVNGDFATDTVWFKNSEWTIGGGVASCDGTQAGGTNIYQKSILEIGKMHKITYEVKTVSAGGVRVLCGGTAGVFRTSIGVYTDYLICSSITWLFFNADPDFIGSVDNISSNTSGNTLDLSTGKTAATWYDLDRDIQGAVTGATLNDSTDFGNNVHETEECPVLLTEPAFTNLFINSRVPVTQTITTVIGVTYIFNCKGVGIGTYEEVGGNGRGGAFTEVNSSPYTATATSVTVTLVGGHSFDWVQMTDTEYPMNHVETLGVSVTKAKDQVNSAGDVNTFDSTAGVLEIEMAALFNDSGIKQISINDGTSNNRALIYLSTNTIVARMIVGGVTQADLVFNPSNIEDVNIIKFKYKVNDFGLKVNGVEEDSSSSGSVPSVNTFNSLDLDNGAGGSELHARTNSIKTYKGIESY